MPNRTATELRTRAAEARRIAGHILNPQAQLELRQMANALDSEADKIEAEARNLMPPPSSGA